jgi:hypothetical protein
VHALPIAASPQVPSMHRPEVHPSGPVQGIPSPCFAAHAPPSQYEDWQSLFMVHGPPFGFVPQVPSMQPASRHWGELVHGCPSGSPHLPW